MRRAILTILLAPTLCFAAEQRLVIPEGMTDGEVVAWTYVLDAELMRVHNIVGKWWAGNGNPSEEEYDSLPVLVRGAFTDRTADISGVAREALDEMFFPYSRAIHEARHAAEARLIQATERPDISYLFEEVAE